MVGLSTPTTPVVEVAPPPHAELRGESAVISPQPTQQGAVVGRSTTEVAHDTGRPKRAAQGGGGARVCPAPAGGERDAGGPNYLMVSVGPTPSPPGPAAQPSPPPAAPILNVSSSLPRRVARAAGFIARRGHRGDRRVAAGGDRRRSGRGAAASRRLPQAHHRQGLSRRAAARAAAAPPGLRDGGESRVRPTAARRPQLS